ncbi:MAG TPA: TonB-dependent receptor [Candidatus Baltobacteraceae bacterium]
MRLLRLAITCVCTASIGLLGFGAASAATAAAGVVGTVTNASTQAPVAGATITLSGGSATRSVTTDSRGSFAFANLTPGTYSIATVAKEYAANTSAPFSVAAGENVTLAVTLAPNTSTALRLIGSVRVNGAQSLNTSSAPTVTITNRQFVQKGQVLVQQALEQTPGVTIEHYNGGLGSVATLTIRGAGAYASGTSNTGYEVLVLQDGEPLRNGQYGDFDLSTLTPAIYSRTEVLKGVGGTSLFGANSIGGTLNLVTRDPFKTEGGEFLGSVGGFGTTDYNFSETNTIGKLGYIFNIHRLTSPGPIPGSLYGDFANYCGSGFAVCTIAHPTQSFDLKSALVKFRYDLSPSTFVTLTGTSESDMRDQLGLQSNPSPQGGQVYDPLGYPYYFGYPADTVYNIQPKVSLDFHTLIGGGNLIFRTYGGILERVDSALDAPNPDPSFSNIYEDRSVDRLYGDELYYTKIFGRHTVTVAAGGNGDNFFDAGGGGFAKPPTFAELQLNAAGKQIERTYLLRDEIEASPRLHFDFAGYYSSYDTLNVKRFDPRLGIVYRPNQQSAMHLSVASGFAPPRLSDIYSLPNFSSQAANSDPRCVDSSGNAIDGGFCAASQGNPGLKAETAVGYDLGYQRIFTRDGRGRVDVDLYRTNLHGHIFTADVPLPTGTTFTDGTPALFISTPFNLAAAVYTGYELSGAFPVSRTFAVNGYYDTQSAYPIDVDAATENLAQTIINNRQFFGVPVHKLGYGISYQNAAGASAFFQGDYFMQNNSLNVAPFWIYNGGYTVPVGENALHLTWQNIFNKNATYWSFFNQGVPYPGFGGPFSTSSHPSNPHMILVTFEHRWGSLKAP